MKANFVCKALLRALRMTPRLSPALKKARGSKEALKAEPKRSFG
jgi:hypothetical protein